MRWLTAATVVTTVTTLVLRVLEHDWRLALAITLALLAVRLGLMIRDVAHGRLPWTRLLLPGVVWIEGVGLAGEGMWEARVATGAVLELVFIGVAIRALVRETSEAPSEIRIARALEAIVPPALARLVAIEMTIVALAVRFVAGGWRKPVPDGFTYHRENGMRMLLPMLPLMAAGDVLLLELVVLPDAEDWVRVVVHVLAAYSVVWLLGVYASTRARPHRLVGERLELYRGVLGHLSILREDVVEIRPMPAFGDGWKERAYRRGSVRLDLGAEHVLEVMLRDGRRLLVGVDDPEAFERGVRGERSADGMDVRGH